jgi:hypothetical protein
MAATTLTESKQKRRMPHAWPEVVLADKPAAWFQMLSRDGDWTPGRARVEALHVDGLGLRLSHEGTLPRGSRLVVNVTLPTLGSLHVRGTVAGTRRDGSRGHAIVVRFEHLAEVDRRALLQHLSHLHEGEEQPMPLQDKRRYRRFVKSMQVEYQVRGGSGMLLPGKGQMVTLDIGGGGFKFRVDHALQAGDVLYVRLPLGDASFFSLGRVAWVEPSRVKQRFLAGLQFIDLPAQEQARLVDHLNKG